MSLEEDPKISRGHVSTCAGVAGVIATAATENITEHMHTLGPSDRSATGLNNCVVKVISF